MHNILYPLGHLPTALDLSLIVINKDLYSIVYSTIYGMTHFIHAKTCSPRLWKCCSKRCRPYYLNSDFDKIDNLLTTTCT